MNAELRQPRYGQDGLGGQVRPIAVSAVLSVVVGFTDALAIAGLAAYLASGLVEDSTEVLGLGSLTEPWVILSLAGVTFAINAVNTLLRERIGADWELARRRDLLLAYEQADYPTQQSHSGAGLAVAGEQVNRASIVSSDLIGLINGAVRVVVMTAFAFVASWNVSLVAVVTGGMLVVGLRQFSLRTRAMNRRLAGRSVAVGEYVGDMAASARELHLLNRWGSARHRLDQELTSIRHTRVRSRFLALLVGPIFALGTVLVGLSVAIWAARSGSVRTTDLAASGVLLIRSLSAAQTAQTNYQSVHDSLPYMDRLLALIDHLRSCARRPAGSELGPDLTIAASGLVVSYGQDTVLHGLDLELSGPGGVAVVGHSGSGKSTLLLALSGLVPPERGVVRFRGADLAGLESERLGADIGYLAQDPRLLRDTLRANLTRPELLVDDPQLHAVLASVGLSDTVAGFAEGLDTVMGRSNEGFSGGELQRLGLARLVVNRPQVWLLDEPTSALDRVNTKRVGALIAEAMRTHLVVVVSHRPELLANCGRLVLLRDGRVIDDGPVSEVARRQPFVSTMIDQVDAATSDGG